MADAIVTDVLARISADASNFVRNMNQAAQSADAFGGSLKNAGNSMNGANQQIQNFAGGASIAHKALVGLGAVSAIAGGAIIAFGVKSFYAAAQVNEMDVAMQAVGNAGAAASTSLGTGFYGSIYADISKLKSSLTTESSQSIASNLIANNSINLASGNGDINITGSNVSSINSDLNLNSMLGNINIKAGESTYSQSSKSNLRNLGGSVGNNGASLNIGFSEAESSLDQTTFTNSQISAINGNLNIKTKQDLKIFGANLLSKNVNLNIGNNLVLKSKQNLLESDSYNIGMSLGISGDSSGVNGGSIGLNLGNGYSSRAFVDQVSSISRLQSQ